MLSKNNYLILIMNAALANQLTCLRILIVPFFVTTVLYYSPEKDYLRYVALALFSLAAALDGLDGYVARRFQQTSQIGAILDPVADKLLLISGFLVLYKMGPMFEVVKFPIWLIVAVLSRDIIILIGIGIIYLLHIPITFQASHWSKACTFSQVFAIVFLLMQWSISHYVWYVVLGLTIISGLDYVIKGFKILQKEA